jgi:hypothetical protein
MNLCEYISIFIFENMHTALLLHTAVLPHTAARGFTAAHCHTLPRAL